jgi:T-complex protein 1 subunit gamma
VKEQTFKTAIEAATLLLRVDDHISGMKKKKEGGGQQGGATVDEEKQELEP